LKHACFINLKHEDILYVTFREYRLFSSETVRMICR